jgi:hypothetical protein
MNPSLFLLIKIAIEIIYFDYQSITTTNFMQISHLSEKNSLTIKQFYLIIRNHTDKTLHLFILIIQGVYT